MIQVILGPLPSDPKSTRQIQRVHQRNRGLHRGKLQTLHRLSSGCGKRSYHPLDSPAKRFQQLIYVDASRLQRFVMTSLSRTSSAISRRPASVTVFYLRRSPPDTDQPPSPNARGRRGAMVPLVQAAFCKNSHRARRRWRLPSRLAPRLSSRHTRSPPYPAPMPSTGAMAMPSPPPPVSQNRHAADTEPAISALPAL